MNEWRSIVGYEGRYAVSATGEIMSMDFKGSGLPGIMKTSPHMSGYRQINLTIKRGVVLRHLVHRLVAQAFLGECPADWQVNHKNGIKSDNNIENLEYCTPSDNKKHSVATGLCTYRLGQEHQNSKLTSADVLRIRELLTIGMSQTEIAKGYRVTRGAIGCIARGRTWAHLKNIEGKTMNKTLEVAA